MKTIKLVVPLFIFSALLLIGCELLSSASEENSLEDSIHQYVEAVKAQNWDKAYIYLETDLTTDYYVNAMAGNEDVVTLKELENFEIEYGDSGSDANVVLTLMQKTGEGLLREELFTVWEEDADTGKWLFQLETAETVGLEYLD
ncbi:MULTISPECIES: hypothetical protein [Bacillaceae]|uniref:Uncharacterized protein n=1 Tax=Evansella alkalicola TaxID=745819 RepID=A0ABS6JYM6_9BACI|nr:MULTISPECIES: hypothetical protein [Bacillaceae]MBU9723696.1 hypothetical protein [Bacillus alkalicola]